MIERFERTHGVNVEMAHPSKKPPINRVTKKHDGGNMWQNMMERTWNKGEAPSYK